MNWYKSAQSRSAKDKIMSAKPGDMFVVLKPMSWDPSKYGRYLLKKVDDQGQWYLGVGGRGPATGQRVSQETLLELSLLEPDD